MSPQNLWKRFQQHLSRISSLGLTLDISRMRFEDDFLDRMAAPVLETVRPVVRCMYDVLECLAVLDKAAGALSHLNSASCNARAGVAAGLHEFSARFRELRREPSSPPAILGDLQAEATGVPVETGYERLLLFGTLFWMRRMDAVQRQFERELASLPADIIPQS